MNFLDSILIRLVMLPSFLYDKLGIDRRQLCAILTAKLTLDNRRPDSLNLGRKKNVNSATITMMSGQLFMGLIILIAFTVGDDMVTKLTFFMAMFSLMICFTLISDFTSVLIDTRDNLIILPKPVSDATIVASRLLHIVIRISLVVLPLVVPSCIAAAVMRGPQIIPPFLLMILLATLFHIFIINAIYILILKITTPVKFQNIIGTIQIIYMIAVMLSGQIIPRMITSSIMQDIGINEIPFVRFMPPFWFADACVMLSGAGYSHSSMISLALAFFVPLLSIGLVVKYLAPSFNRKLGMITGVTSEQSNTLSQTVEKTGKKSFLHTIARWMTKPGLERGGFIFAARMISRSRDFKMKVYPSFGSMIIIIIVLLQDSISSGNILAGPKLIFILLTVIYMCGLPVGTAFMYVVYSDKFKASWIFFISPLKKPGEIISGAAKYIIVKFVVPLIIPLIILGVVLSGFSALPNLLLSGVNLLAISSFLAFLFFKKPPFTEAPETFSNFNSFGKAILLLAVFAAVGGVHVILSRFPWVVFFWTILSIVVIRFIWNKIKGYKPDGSVPRQIWRAAYPILIFIIIPAIVSAIAGVIYVIGFVISNGGTIPDKGLFNEQLKQWAVENVLLFNMIGQALCLTFFIPIWSRIRKSNPLYTVEYSPFKVSTIVFLAFLGFNIFLSFVLSITNVGKLSSYETVVTFLTNSNIFVRLLAIAIIAPIVEEICFRGIVLGRLLSWMPVRTAVIVQALLFGIAHLNPVQGAYSFVVGLAFGFLYVRFRKVWLCIIAHFAFNLSSFILSSGQDNGMDAAVLTIFVAGVILAVLCSFLLLKLPRAALLDADLCQGNEPCAVPENHKNLTAPVNYKTGGSKTLFLVVILIAISLSITIIFPHNDIKPDTTTPVNNIEADIRIYTDDWHDVSLPMSINDLNNLGITFNEEELEGYISPNWQNTLGAAIFFNEQRSGNMNVDIDSREVVRLYFSENIPVTIGELEMGKSKRRDIDKFFGKPLKIFGDLYGIYTEYRMNNNRILLGFQDLSTPKTLNNEEGIWTNISIISMDVVPIQRKIK